MFLLRKSNERGASDLGWLKSRFSFSFAEYRDLEHMGFRCLRVINEDHIMGGGGFPTHPHRDMEIITYIIDGALEHKDTIGNSTVINRDDVQRMSAGTGVFHSEFNHFKNKTTHLLQIWIIPAVKGIEPGYEQKSFRVIFGAENFVCVASGASKEGAITIHQDADLFVGRFKTLDEKSYAFRPGRHGWIQLISGQLKITDGPVLNEGDGLAISDVPSVKFMALAASEFLFFDLP